MISWGINIDLRNAILDPGFEQIRLSETCKFWVIDAFELRYQSLEGLGEESRWRARHAQRRGKQEASEEISLLGGYRSQRNEPCYTEFPERVPGFTRLYKGSRTSRFSTVLYNDEQGKKVLELVRANSGTRPTDFQAIAGGLALYFTPQLHIAEQYARWDKKRAPTHSTAVFFMDVPNNFISEWKPRILKGDEWKKLVHASRAKLFQFHYPKELSYLRDHRLLVGPICTGTDQAIAKLASWQDSNERNIMKERREQWNEAERKWEFGTDEINSWQYAFIGEEIVKDLHDLYELEDDDLALKVGFVQQSERFSLGER